MTVASKTDRDSRLDDLKEAVTNWRTKKRRQLEDQLELAERVLKGRKGSQGLNNTSVQQASSLLVDEIEEFLTGGG